MRAGNIRSGRDFVWGAVACALVVVLLNAWRADAALSVAEATYSPIAPCRLFDYRPAPFTVGPRTSPLGPDEVYTQQVTGLVGDCAVPGFAVAVAMNVTIVQPTAASHLTIYPADEATAPTASNLNWTAGQAATPNKVDVKLSPTGAIKMHNYAGSVYVLADVVGFYSTTSLDALRARVTALESTTPHVAEVTASPYSGVVLTSAASTVLTLPTYVTPAAGHVVLTATVWASSAPSGQDVYCAILPASATPGVDELWTYPGAMIFEPDGLSNDGSVSGTRTFAVTNNQSVTYALWCQREPTATAGYVYTRNLVMTYLPG